MNTDTLAAMLCPATAQHPADKRARTQQATPVSAGFNKQLAQMQENINKMQQQTDKICQPQDPQERQRLLQENWTMQAAIELMHASAGQPRLVARKSEGMTGWRRMRDYYGKLTPVQLKQRHHTTDQHLHMHQTMWDQDGATALMEGTAATRAKGEIAAVGCAPSVRSCGDMQR